MRPAGPNGTPLDVLTGIRLESAHLRRAAKLTGARLYAKVLPRSRSGVLREAIERGLHELELEHAAHQRRGR